jgi:hypothetical protein
MVRFCYYKRNIKVNEAGGQGVLDQAQKMLCESFSCPNLLG